MPVFFLKNLISRCFMGISPLRKWPKNFTILLLNEERFEKNHLGLYLDFEILSFTFKPINKYSSA